MKYLELLLMQDVPTLGNKGKIVKVKAGYGRNYLIPQKIAAAVTQENLRQLEILKKKQLLEEEAKKKELEKIAENMRSVTCVIEAKVNQDGHLFGSITYAKIAEAFQKQNINVKAEDIQLDDASLYPIKDLGFFPVQIRLHPEVVAKSKVCVMKEPDTETK